MALRLRRGLDLDRVGVVFAEGELVYTTDTKRLHIGDGVTAGGIPAGDLLGDTSPQLGGTLDLNTHDIVGIGQMSIEGDISSAGTILANTIIGNFKGTFSADDSTILIDGINNKLVLSNNELNDLSDVNLSSLSLSQFLKWSGTEWENNYVTLSDLSDVTIAGAPAVGQVLKYDGVGWVPSDDLTISGLIVGDLKGSVFGDDSTVLVDSVNGRLNLDRNDFADFPNVTIGTLSSGDVLKYNGAIWENTGLSTADLSDVSVTMPSVGDILTWQGTAWIPGPFSGSLTGDLKGSVFGDDSTVLVDSVRGILNLSRNELADLFDIDTAAPTNNQVLAWNGVRWTPTDIANIQLDYLTGDVKGSVFADDSTVMVDSVLGRLNLSNNNIDELNNVITIGAVQGHILQYSGLTWQSTDPESAFPFLRTNIFGDLQGDVQGLDSSIILDSNTKSLAVNTISVPAGGLICRVNATNNASNIFNIGQNAPGIFAGQRENTSTILKNDGKANALFLAGYNDQNGQRIGTVVNFYDNLITFGCHPNGFIPGSGSFEPPAAELVTISSTSGAAPKLGVGTRTPSQELDIIGNATIAGFMQVGRYTDGTARDAAITSPGEGMIVFNQSTQKYQGYVSDTGLAGGGPSNTTPGWVDLY